MTEIETANKILEQGNCDTIKCKIVSGNEPCPAHVSGMCTARSNHECPILCQGGLDSHGRKFFEDFLKSKEGKGVDKAEAIKRLDALDHEAAELRKIIERGDKIEYDGHNVYVAVRNGLSYLLVGRKEDTYFRWHCFGDSWGTESGWDNNHGTGQDAIDNMIDDGGDIHVFTDPKEGIQFFYDQYMKAH